MSRPISEKRIVDVLVSHYRRDYPIGREVRFYEKRIDVGVYEINVDCFWAIEAKIKDWQRALSQAIVNLSASNKSYIAIYEKYAHRVPESILDEHGIGLISVGSSWGSVVVLKEARSSKYVNILAVKRITARVAKGK